MFRNTGIGTYIRGVLGALKELGAFEQRAFGFFGPESVRELFAEVPVTGFTAPIYSLREQAAYPGLLSRCRLWHAPHYNVPLFKPRGTRLVVTVHDLIHWVFRHQFFSPAQRLYAGLMFKRAVCLADRIITVSSHTSADLMKYFGADPDKITVIHEAADPRFNAQRDETQIAAVQKKYGLLKPYFLFVGSIKPHKNVQSLIPLFRTLHRENPGNPDLVIAGRKDRRYPRGFEALADLTDGEGIRHLSNVEDCELKALYQGALALVHPALYEGFGLTLLEAMGSGTPVIASQSASIPEVTGDGACLVDSSQDHAMMQAVRKVMNDPVYRAGLKERSLRRASQFTWRETASKTLALYEKVLSGK